MRQTVISDPGIDILANAGLPHGDGLYGVPEGRDPLFDAFIHAHYRATAMRPVAAVRRTARRSCWSPSFRADFNWQRAYTFAEPVKIPAGLRLIARYWYDNSKRNPHNLGPEHRGHLGRAVVPGRMLFTQVDLSLGGRDRRRPDRQRTAAFADSRILGFLDKNLDGKVEKSELRGQIGKALAAQFDALDTDHDGSLDKAELKVGP